MPKLPYIPSPGTTLFGAVNELQGILKKNNVPSYKLSFNDTIVKVHVTSRYEDIATIYTLKRELESLTY